MTITECGGFLRMGGCTKMQSDEAQIIIKECFSQTSSFHLVQFSSVQFNGVPRRPDHLRKRSGRHGAAQLAWLDERCWHGRVIPSAARRARARGPPLTSFGVMAFWPDKGRQGGDGGWRSGGKGEGPRAFTECAPHPARTHYLTHACARDTQAPATCHGCSSGGVGAGR